MFLGLTSAPHQFLPVDRCKSEHKDRNILWFVQLDPTSADSAVVSRCGELRLRNTENAEIQRSASLCLPHEESLHTAKHTAKRHRVSLIGPWQGHIKLNC